MQITDVSRSNVEAVSQQADAAVKKNAENTSTVETISKKRDEYISTEKEEPVGLYKKTVDDSGNSVIEFDKSTEAANLTADDNISAEQVKNLSEESALSAKDKSAAKTDKKSESKIKSHSASVDGSGSEIKKLKDKVKQLKKQISSAEGQDAFRLKAKLKAVQSEISRKSNMS